MKILTLVYNLDKGGTQRAAQVFAEAYHELKHDSKIISLYGLGVRYDEIKDKIKVWDKLSPDNLEDIKSWNPDIIHIHSHGPKEKDINTLLDNIENAKVIETNVFSKPSAWASKVDVSLQLSQWANWVFNLRGGKNLRSAIVPYAVKCSSFQKVSESISRDFRDEHDIPQDAFIMGRIGQSFPGKWSPMLLSVFNDLASKHDHLYLLIVNAPKIILTLIDASPYKRRIKYIPTIFGDENLSTVYSSMDVMVLIAEQGESFGMVLAESILCETPVVTLNTPWADNSQGEVVRHLIGGYVANTESGIKKSITMLINGDGLLSIKDKGVKHIYDTYNYLKVANQALESVDKKTGGDEYINVLEDLESAIDKPSLITVSFLKMNSDIFRRLTIYSSNYHAWYKLGVKILKKIIRK